tara:strand:+ start:218 stop:403 length:186 start_codon:yes stop_codon:yes gene_type:complete
VAVVEGLIMKQLNQEALVEVKVLLTLRLLLALEQQVRDLMEVVALHMVLLMLLVVEAELAK